MAPSPANKKGKQDAHDAVQKNNSRTEGQTGSPLQVQALGGHNVSADLLQTLVKLLGQVLVAHDLGGLGHLAQEFLETAEQANKRALVNVGHFAEQISIFQTHHVVIVTYQISENGRP